MDVSAALLREANLALRLSQTRYQLGLSSMVELSQAELQQTDAAIGEVDARYQYLLALASLRYETGARP
jgi:outer membrane protein